ncbi:proclotting enzyme-like [Penaeus japonicus]|uniref:proclotting enzyme-like n=1 Tax=Penaeus japonicus TaxID=27405 RepID=UPI001C71551A|nr:proclotting enzyme-like [Penaeus japonicus]
MRICVRKPVCTGSHIVRSNGDALVMATPKYGMIKAGTKSFQIMPQSSNHKSPFFSLIDFPNMCGRNDVPPGEEVTVQTPYFPNKYPQFKCTWIFTSASKEGFLLNCPEFMLGRGDVLTTLTINEKKSFKKYMWGKGPVNQLLAGPAIKMVFRSNRWKNTKGFTCSLTELGAATTTTTTATTTPPAAQTQTTTETPSPSTTTTAVPTTTTTTAAPTTTTTTAAPTTTTTTAAPTTTTTTAAPTTTTTTAAPTTTTTAAPTTTTTTLPTTTLPPLSYPECGLVNRASSRIVNGYKADVHEYPWQTYLEMRWSDGQNQLCGGSLITPQWVITAAHCVLRKKSDDLWLPTVSVTLGMHRRSAPLADGGEKVAAAEIKIYPENNFSHDLALIKLPEPVEYTDKVRPVCLPNRYMHEQSVSGKSMALIGWGKTETGKLSDELRELGRLGIESSVCKKVFGSYITDHHFCTSGTDVKHICLGDSGGPVMTVERSRFVLMGVVSFVATKNCDGEYPDGHTSVTHFLDWIQETTGHVIY